jgi:hypothetical protein
MSEKQSVMAWLEDVGNHHVCAEHRWRAVEMHDCTEVRNAVESIVRDVAAYIRDMDALRAMVEEVEA